MHQTSRHHTALADSLGRRTTLTRGNGVATTYGFDNASRLTQLVSNPAGTSYDLTLDLSYNDAGQIKSRTASNDAYAWTGATNILHSDTTNGLNQVTLSGGIGVGYDARGNLNASGSNSYTYSAENLLTSATVGAVTTAMTYDPLMRLYQIGTSGGMKLVYDGTAIIGQSNGTTMGRRYVTVPGTDEVLVEYKVSTGTKDYKLTDERGSVIAATDASGNGTSINAYDEYGLPNAAGNSMRFQYTGQFYLGEVGLYYYKARMYSPTLGRFMQTDPIGYGDGLNWYNYVGSDPVNRSDPSGLLDGTCRTVGDTTDCRIPVGGTDCSPGARCYYVDGPITGEVPYIRAANEPADSAGASEIVINVTIHVAKPKLPIPGAAPPPRRSNTNCAAIVDLVAGVVLITGGGVSGMGVMEGVEAAELLKVFKVVSAAKAIAIGTGVGFVALLAGSTAYYFLRPQIISAVCGK